MHLTVHRVEFDKLTSSELGENSSVVRDRVSAARERQWRRLAEHPSATCNAEMRIADIRTFCELDSGGAALVRSAVEHLSLSARGYHRVLRVARTIADLDGSDHIQSMHLAEAVQYQPRDRLR
jgi:magnesium chelatase family protein